jgi:hypothetical protein
VFGGCAAAAAAALLAAIDSALSSCEADPLVLLLLLLLLLPPNKPPSNEPNPVRGLLPAGLVEFELPVVLLLLLLPSESPPGTLIPLLLLLLLLLLAWFAGANASALRSPRSDVMPAAVLPPDALSWFIHKPASAIGLLALVIEGIPLAGNTTFITPGSAKSAAAAALLLLLPLSDI